MAEHKTVDEARKLRDDLPPVVNEGAERAQYFLDAVAGRGEVLLGCLSLVKAGEWGVPYDLYEESFFLEGIVAYSGSDMDLLNDLIEHYLAVTCRDPSDAVRRLVRGARSAAKRATGEAIKMSVYSLRELVDNIGRCASLLKTGVDNILPGAVETDAESIPTPSRLESNFESLGELLDRVLAVLHDINETIE